MIDFVERISQAISTRRLYGREQGILVAVSGGLDSMVLLQVLAILARSNGWRLTVAHFNHQLRGRSSDADERLVRQTAKKLRLPFVAGRADVRRFARNRKLSVEMAARELRHQFLARTASQRKLRCIALAHHADDQVELFFLRLLRGAGGEGLGGMKWQSPSPADAGISLTRPLLGETRETLEAWLRQQRIPFREDASNARFDAQRNRIRHELVPLLKKNYQPALTRVILRQMEILGGEAALANAAAGTWQKAKRRAPFGSLPMAVQRRCLHLQLVEQGVAANFDLIEQIREAADRPVAVNEKFFVRRDAAGRVSTSAATQARFNLEQKKLHLRGSAGEAVFDGVRFRWKIAPGGNGTVRAPKPRLNGERFDADKVGKVLILRHWRPGDRFQPIGMKNPVKLQNLFTNQKIPRARRRELLVATAAGGVLFWVEGLRLAEHFKLDKATIRQLHWRWERV